LEPLYTFKSIIAIVFMDKKNPAIFGFVRRQIFVVAPKGITRAGHVHKVSLVSLGHQDFIF